MFWIFASIVLTLAVLVPAFREFLGKCLLVVSGLAGIAVVAAICYNLPWAGGVLGFIALVLLSNHLGPVHIFKKKQPNSVYQVPPQDLKT